MLPLFYPSVLITLLFFLSGIEKIYTFTKTTIDFSNKINIPISLSKLVIICVILLEIIAPIIIVGYTFTGLSSLLQLFKISLISLIVFTIVATIMYHNPFEGGKKYYESILHLSIIGGLLALYKM
uniref:DoxX family protein n=1 Tax=viral metagenome TaxID=1070528 RepID=A0A6C0LFM3_9ZZZZ